MLEVSRVGLVVTATFSRAIEIDTTDVPLCNAAYFQHGLYGFEFLDGGVFIDISSVVVAGSVATITLAAEPVGVEHLRIAQHAYPGGNVDRMPRSNIRATEVLSPGVYDYALPQGITL